jgi:flagellar assembly protein FliH
MASYSKIFKASQLSVMEEVKVIAQPITSHNPQGIETDSGQNQGVMEGNATQSAQQVIQEANDQAQAIIDRAQQHARSIEADAENKISQWWTENEKKFEVLSLEAEQQGFKDGLVSGRQEAEAEMQQKYHEKLEQVQQLLQQGYEQKVAIISEAEPFLLELSTVIAKQIVKQELDGNPEKFVELIKQHILRFKEKEVITVCVHPEDFDFIQSQRAHLVAIVNGETEIKIIPDPTVSEKGCIIRTAYGSVDARIDTQIEEIKKVILEARREPESGIID